MENIETILTSCIKEIKSGKSTVAECLDRYPLQREELAPLLQIAMNIKEPPIIELDRDYKLAARARLLQQIKDSNQNKSRSFTDIFNFGIPAQFIWARIAVSVVMIIIVISLIGGSTAYAAQSSLPGDFLYPVKTGIEDTRIWIASSNLDKASLELEFAGDRLEEMDKLAENGSKTIDLAVDGYDTRLQAMAQELQGITDTVALGGILDNFAIEIQEQLLYCDNIIDTNPAYSGQTGRANNIAVSHFVTLLKMLANQNSLTATQLNLDMMNIRLQRAGAKASEQQYQMMQQVLLQYQQLNQLGEQILQEVPESNDQADLILSLSSQALQGYLGILNTLIQEVPEGYQDSIRTSREQTMNYQNQVQNMYQHRGGSGQGQGPGQGNDSTGDNLSSGTSSNFQGEGSGSGNQNHSGLANEGGELSSGMENNSGNNSGTGDNENREGGKILTESTTTMPDLSHNGYQGGNDTPPTQNGGATGAGGAGYGNTNLIGLSQP